MNNNEIQEINSFEDIQLTLFNSHNLLTACYIRVAGFSQYAAASGK